MKSSQYFAITGFAVWLISSCAFAVGSGNAGFALALFFAPCIALLGRKQIDGSNRDRFVHVLAITGLVLGSGIYDALAPIGGLSFIASILFESPIVLVSSNGLFIIYLLRTFGRPERRSSGFPA